MVTYLAGSMENSKHGEVDEFESVFGVHIANNEIDAYVGIEQRLGELVFARVRQRRKICTFNHLISYVIGFYQCLNGQLVFI